LIALKSQRQASSQPLTPICLSEYLAGNVLKSGLVSPYTINGGYAHLKDVIPKVPTTDLLFPLFTSHISLQSSSCKLTQPQCAGQVNQTVYQTPKTQASPGALPKFLGSSDSKLVDSTPQSSQSSNQLRYIAEKRFKHTNVPLISMAPFGSQHIVLRVWVSGLVCM
jgi:hypothetical protein